MSKDALPRDERASPSASRFGAGLGRFLRQGISPATVFLNLAMIILLRMFLEELLEDGHRFFQPWDSYDDLNYYLHMFASWVCIFLSMTLPVKAFLGLSYRESLRFTLLFFPVILTVPAIDFLATGGAGARIVYAQELSLFADYFLGMLNPFQTLPLVTPGVRCEILAVTAGSFLLALFPFRRGLLRSILLAVSIYLSIFFYGFLPSLVEALGVNLEKFAEFSATGVIRSQRFAFIYLWLFFVLSAAAGWVLFREDRARVRAVASLAFPSRSLHYLLLLVFGFLYAAQAGAIYGRLLNGADVSKLAMALVSIFLLFVHAKITNDMNDLTIDRISNPGRPLVSGVLTTAAAGSLGRLAWGAGWVAALMTAKIFICCWLALWAASHVYSAPPFRLRRFYPAGHLTLAAIGSLVFLAGTMLALGDGAYNRISEKAIFVYVFLAFFCLCHLKDFKDMEGDRAAGVGNILARLRWPRLAGVAAIWGYCLFVGLIAERLRLNLLPAVVLFGTAGTAYVLRVQEPARIDRLIPLSLLLLSALAIAFFAAYGSP